MPEALSRPPVTAPVAAAIRSSAWPSFGAVLVTISPTLPMPPPSPTCAMAGFGAVTEALASSCGSTVRTLPAGLRPWAEPMPLRLKVSGVLSPATVTVRTDPPIEAPVIVWPTRSIWLPAFRKLLSVPWKPAGSSRLSSAPPAAKATVWPLPTDPSSCRTPPLSIASVPAPVAEPVTVRVPPPDTVRVPLSTRLASMAPEPLRSWAASMTTAPAAVEPADPISSAAVASSWTAPPEPMTMPATDTDPPSLTVRVPADRAPVAISSVPPAKLPPLTVTVPAPPGWLPISITLPPALTEAPSLTISDPSALSPTMNCASGAFTVQVEPAPVTVALASPDTTPLMSTAGPDPP